MGLQVHIPVRLCSNEGLLHPFLRFTGLKKTYGIYLFVIKDTLFVRVLQRMQWTATEVQEGPSAGVFAPVELGVGPSSM